MAIPRHWQDSYNDYRKFSWEDAYKYRMMQGMKPPEKVEPAKKDVEKVPPKKVELNMKLLLLEQ